MPIVADQNSDFAVTGSEYRESKIPRLEIEFLNKMIAVRNMHLPVLADDLAIRFDDKCRIIINPGNFLFIDGCQQHHLTFFRLCHQSISSPAWNRFSEIEIFRVALPIWKIDRIEHLLQGYD